jgi:hypothetical protein
MRNTNTFEAAAERFCSATSSVGASYTHNFSAISKKMRKGCPARTASMTPERRAEIAKKTAAKRWGKVSA